jgi:hypothetical protein
MDVLHDHGAQEIFGTPSDFDPALKVIEPDCGDAAACLGPVGLVAASTRRCSERMPAPSCCP